MFRIAIVDDDIKFAEELKCILNTKLTIEEYIIDIYEKVDNNLLSKTYDIVFLDVLLEDGESFKYSNQLIDSLFKNVIVYISNYDHFIYDSQKYNSYYYIRKSNLENDLDSFFNKYFSLHKTYQNKLEVQYKGETFIIPQYKIIYIEYYQKKIKIYTDKDVIELRMSLKEVYKLLDQFNFYKLNASVILNFEHISNIGTEYIEMKNNHKIRFTQNSKTNFIKRFVDYKEKNLWN